MAELLEKAIYDRNITLSTELALKVQIDQDTNKQSV